MCRIRLEECVSILDGELNQILIRSTNKNCLCENCTYVACIYMFV